jgi:hypothetical protein
MEEGKITVINCYLTFCIRRNDIRCLCTELSPPSQYDLINRVHFVHWLYAIEEWDGEQKRNIYKIILILYDAYWEMNWCYYEEYYGMCFIIRLKTRSVMLYMQPLRYNNERNNHWHIVIIFPIIVNGNWKTAHILRVIENGTFGFT